MLLSGLAAIALSLWWQQTPEPPNPDRMPTHSGKISTLINPAGTYNVTLEAMPLHKSLCEPGFLALTALLVTKQYNYIWRRNGPEIVYFRFWSGNAKTFGTEFALETPAQLFHLPVTSTALGGGPCKGFVWEHSTVLSRGDFLAIANAPSVRFEIADGQHSLSPDHLAGLRDLAQHMEPEDAIANPPDPQVFPFDGDLNEGVAYIAEVQREGDLGWWPVDPIRLPHHHAVALEWMNLGEFPELAAKSPARHTLVFQVVRRKAVPMTPQRWNTLIECKILKVM